MFLFNIITITIFIINTIIFNSDAILVVMQGISNWFRLNIIIK